MDITTALKLIIARSDVAMGEAMNTLRAYQAKSPIINTRYARTLDLALNDPSAQFTPDERAGLVSCLEIDAPESKSEMIALRLTPSEMDHIRTLAEGSGQSISDYIRDKIL